MTRWTTVRFGVISVLAAIALLAAAQPRGAAAQSQQTQRLMRQKLSESQQLLSALVTSDWKGLDAHSKALLALTNQPGWDVMRLPEFHTYTTAFQRAIEALAASAGQRDQRTALTAYNGLVSSCVECHRYVARARIAAVR